MTQSRVLITGGAGFIGSFAAERFHREGWAVRVLDDLSTGNRSNCDESWDLRVADVRDANAMAEAVSECTAVVHLAAFTSVPESFERHEVCYRTNVGGTFQVLDACTAAGVPKLVFASSSAVYAELPDAPKRETDCPDPISPYAVSKLEGEHLCAAFRETRGLSTTALRFFNVFGPRQPADSDYAAAVPIFVERGLSGETLTIYGDGKQTRDFVYVEDVAEAIFNAAVGGAEGVMNVGTGSAMEVLTLANTIAKLTGGPSTHRFEPPRAGDVRSSLADVSRIAEATGWRARSILEDALGPTLAWWKERLQRNHARD